VSQLFWDMLTRSTDELVAKGTAIEDVVDLRFAATGHVRPLSPRWLKSFGCWGSVLDLDEITAKVGVAREVVKDYAKGRGLRYATKNLRRTHAELALELWGDRARSPQESCQRFGCYPGERRLLLIAAQALVDRWSTDCVMKWTIPELNSKFEALKVNFAAPTYLSLWQAAYAAQGAP
jgi:hypothetical protein